MKKLGRLIISVSSMMSGLAWGQSSVTLFGIVDVGIVSRSQQAASSNQNAGGSAIAMNSGFWTPSQWGILGKEDLDQALKFELVVLGEPGVDRDVPLQDLGPRGREGVLAELLAALLLKEPEHDSPLLAMLRTAPDQE